MRDVGNENDVGKHIMMFTYSMSGWWPNLLKATQNTNQG